MSGPGEFAEQLRLLGYTPTASAADQVWFPWEITLGRFAGRTVRLGFVVFADFALTPPTGPHVFPRILPINTNGGVHPLASVHPSPFGEDWEYWSRPFPSPPGWASTDRSVKTYLKHIENLFRTL